MSFNLLENIIDFVEELESKRKFVIAHQLLKCGTSLELIFSEAQSAENKNDFIP